MSSELKKQRKRLLVITVSIGLGLSVFIVLIGSIRRSVELSLSNGGYICVTPPSLWGTFLSKSSWKIFYRPKDGEAGTVILLGDTPLQLEAGQPAMIIPAANGKTLLCLYYADVLYRLMRIDQTQKSKPFPKDSYLNYIVLGSSWDIKPGTTNDWYEVAEYLKTVPLSTYNKEALTTLDLGIWRFYFSREDLLSAVELQITNMQRGATY